MYSITIDKDTIPTELIPGVEAANQQLIETLQLLGEVYDVITAKWHGGTVRGQQKVFLDLVTDYEGKEYSVRDYAFSPVELSDHDPDKLQWILWTPISKFRIELSRLNRDFLKAAFSRSEAMETTGVE